MKKWEREILSEIGLFLIYVKDILMGGIAAALVVWGAVFVIIMAIANETIGVKEAIVLYVLIYILSTACLSLMIPFEDWEESHMQEREENKDTEDEK